MTNYSISPGEGNKIKAPLFPKKDMLCKKLQMNTGPVPIVRREQHHLTLDMCFQVPVSFQIFLISYFAKKKYIFLWSYEMPN